MSDSTTAPGLIPGEVVAARPPLDGPLPDAVVTREELDTAPVGAENLGASTRDAEAFAPARQVAVVDPALTAPDVPPATIPTEAGNPVPEAPLGYDPQNLREFDPAVVLLHLERDGIIVEGPINPFNGDGTHDLLVELQDNLAKARAGIYHPAAPAAQVQSVHAGADPNALKRQRAVENGHRFDPDKPGSACLNCAAAEWATLDGLPCVPNPAAD